MAEGGPTKAYWLTASSAAGFLTDEAGGERQRAKDKWALDDVVMTSQVTHPLKDVNAQGRHV